MLPLNGETAYADTAAAYAALSADERHELDATMVRRRLRRGDPGWLIPLVYTNPRTGTKALHSPVWASRGKRIAPVEVDGLGEDDSRRFLDRLEAHCLRPEFRYDHVHTPGDVTIWSNFATLHVAPPMKHSIDDPADARLMYRMSCKGIPSYRVQAARCSLPALVQLHRSRPVAKVVAHWLDNLPGREWDHRRPEQPWW